MGIWPQTVAEGWVAAGAIGALLTASAALVGLSAILVARQQVRQQARHFQQQIRMSASPYLRVDLAPARSDGTWTPPDVESRFSFDFAAFNPGVERPPDVFDEWQQPPLTDICVWVENQQTHPAGVAGQVLIQVEIEMPSPSLGRDVFAQYDVLLHYLEPGRRVRYLLGRVSDSVPFVRGRVSNLRYTDIYQTRLGYGHGSAEFEWVGSTMANGRRIFEGE